jgi:hypothetical protein
MYEFQQGQQEPAGDILGRSLKPNGMIQTNSLDAPSRTPAVAVAAQRLEKLIESQRQTIANLSTRLDSVCRPALPHGEDNKFEKDGPACPLSAFLTILANKVSANCVIIEDLLQRLEV